MKLIRLIIYLLLLSFCHACEGLYSTLDPAGKESQTIATIFWWMLGGGTLIWLIFTGIFFYAYLRPKPHHPRKTAFFIIGGGVLFPVIFLSILLYFSLRPLPDLLRPAPAGSLTVEVTGFQWWWRVRYLMPDGKEIDLANEIHLPVNRPVQFLLKSADVIHSFWIPSLGGKIDMIPGRTNQLTLTPTKEGTFGSVCAEYCGASHALMKLKVVVKEKNQFDEWLENESRPAFLPSTPEAKKGQRAFVSYGCVACHRVRGLEESGLLAPDLTHVGSRLTIGGGILSNTHTNLNQWIKGVQKIKPGVKMPSFDMMTDEELHHLSIWLKELK